MRSWSPFSKCNARAEGAACVIPRSSPLTLTLLTLSLHPAGLSHGRKRGDSHSHDTVPAPAALAAAAVGHSSSLCQANLIITPSAVAGGGGGTIQELQPRLTERCVTPHPSLKSNACSGLLLPAEHTAFCALKPPQRGAALHHATASATLLKLAVWMEPPPSSTPATQLTFCAGRAWIPTLYLRENESERSVPRPANGAAIIAVEFVCGVPEERQTPWPLGPCDSGRR